MNPAEFQDKWRRAELTERSAAQQHFLDLCELLDHPKPADVDPKGELFTFEKGAAKRGGSDGWADVWKRGYFAFDYKGKHKDLAMESPSLESAGLLCRNGSGATTGSNPPEDLPPFHHQA